MGPGECAVSKALEQQRRSTRKIPEMYIFKFNHYGFSGVTNNVTNYVSNDAIKLNESVGSFYFQI